MSENAEMHETILLVKQQLDSLSTNKSSNFPRQSVNDEITHGTCFEVSTESKTRWKDGCHSYEETTVDENTPTSVISLDRVLMCEDSKECNQGAFLNSQLLMLVTFLIYLIICLAISAFFTTYSDYLFLKVVHCFL